MLETYYTMEELIEIIKILRSENGCPWDRAQTHESLKTCLIEEAYEVLEGIDISTKTGNDENLCEELGDLFLQVLLHADIARQENRFTLEDVVDGLAKKMIRRHPHVFRDKKAATISEGLKNWEEMKQEEKKGKKEEFPLETIPKSFPALLRAQKIQKKAEKVYGITLDLEKSFNRAEKDLKMLRDSGVGGQLGSKSYIIEELLFEITNIARIFEENAENSLTNAIEQFINKQEGVDI